MRATNGISVLAALIAGVAIVGAATTANAETARKVSSATNAQYQARYDYVPATQPQVARPQAVTQPQADTASDNSAPDKDIYFYHAMGTMSRP
ncbi:hypothetical protein [Lichenifustis flavocetrariae]|uniref:Uncharacterized protein n=1 Tax=Lichenifustis flavocetrariae TaxID=2949735 RepID=A0AA41YWU4_9HYPH|nr:hypothetical protein [Lichenifustis flavocetrariae]MCW6509579.1 hypothetical protein [Lichenifustis flavocetrariae]